MAAKLLLPNTTVSEIISYVAPEAVKDKPDWYLRRHSMEGLSTAFGFSFLANGLAGH